MALLALVALVAMISIYYIVGSLNRTTAEVSAERNTATLQVLNEAKAALIAYAASQAWEDGGATDQPGSLPCPGFDEDQSTLISCTSAASTRVGWFPWKKVGTSKLLDSSGTALWYALSANFRKASGTTVINSDTVGTLTLYDDSNSTSSPNQSAVVAIIIAPGAPLAVSTSPPVMQNRLTNNIANYLDCRNSSATDAFSSSSPPSTYGTYCPHSADTQTAEIFNDQVITITQAELMAAVEPAVAARIARDIVPSIFGSTSSYFGQWGRFPYPSSFTGGPSNNPGAASGASTRLESAYLGDSSLTTGRGLLPITTSSASYSPSSISITATGGTVESIGSSSCVSIGSPSAGIDCSFNLIAVDVGSSYWLSTTCRNPSNGTRYRYCLVNPAFSVVGSIDNMGLSFANKPVLADVTVTNSSGSTNRTMTSTAFSISLISNGTASASYSGTHVYSNYSNSNFSRAMRVTVPVTTMSVISSDDPTAGWFLRNEWYRQLYYVASPGYLPGASGSCSTIATPYCLTVNGFPITTYPVSNDKQAILILGGYTLNSNSRPSGAVSNYLEGANATSAANINPSVASDFSYTHHTGKPTTTNDRVIVIAP